MGDGLDDDEKWIMNVGRVQRLRTDSTATNELSSHISSSICCGGFSSVSVNIYMDA